MMKKILVVFGTRPEAIKLAPVIRVLKENKNFETIVCSTGQHREMLKQVLQIFDLEVDLDLDMMIPNQTLFDITINSLKKLNDVLEDIKPNLLIVQGDTTTAFATALAAFYKKIKVAHVEAGLRSYDVFNPFPEEANRRFISVIADFNFAPTQDSVNYLLKEGFSPDKIYLTGNTVIDALHLIAEKFGMESFSSKIKKGIEEKYGSGILRKEFILITLHRREKFGGEMTSLLGTIKTLARKYPQYNFIYPVHLNPNVQKPVNEILNEAPNVLLTEPMDYLSFLYMMQQCRFIMSDSGGVQEECFVFRKPIIVLRSVTERNEAIKAGYAFLTGSDAALINNIFEMIENRLADNYDFFPLQNPFGDGNASLRIAEIIEQK